MTGSGTPDSSGSVTVSQVGNGVTSAEYEISVIVPLTSGLIDLQSNGKIGLLFSSADCGNDVIQGVVETGYGSSSAAAIPKVPEPGPGVLILTGIVLLAVGKQWRKRTT
jgi:hypothetical protein